MTARSCFVGVVSHEGSRFSASQGADGLAAHLAVALARSDVAVRVQVNTQDLHDPAAIPIDRALIQACLGAQLDIERRWEDYLRVGTRRGLHQARQRALRWGLRQWRRLRSPDGGFVRRLINIEMSHVDLLRSGLAGGEEWILILEDDAESADVDDCALGLAGLMLSAPPGLAFVNVSESFTLGQLGIDHLLAPGAAMWSGPVQRSVLGASRPVTNTVCAILYRATFASDLLAEFDRMPMTPVVPIDWKLNEALMAMFARGDLGPGSCWLVDPAPVTQMSMHTTPVAG